MHLNFQGIKGFLLIPAETAVVVAPSVLCQRTMMVWSSLRIHLIPGKSWWILETIHLKSNPILPVLFLGLHHLYIILYHLTSSYNILHPRFSWFDIQRPCFVVLQCLGKGHATARQSFRKLDLAQPGLRAALVCGDMWGPRG